MMRGQTREAFFARIRESLTDRGAPVELPSDLEVARVTASGVDLVTLFMDRAQQVGMRPERVVDDRAAAAKVVEIVTAAGRASAILPEEDIPARALIVDGLKGKGVRLMDVNDRDAAFDADFGITGVSCAIAETGSLCVDSGGTHRRLASLAVPHHIALVRAEQIVPDLLDFAARVSKDDIPANMTLISAPSKTADIEMILVEGVHGPKVVHIIVIAS
ncbi:MAG TPA: lactate utilization protein [Phycisphaerae bacterium]|nr:lactate utilization protein [Phycisphaerae bacterium]HRR84051.1 lactate utilization protein [Phycisphaerae bacterium]